MDLAREAAGSIPVLTKTGKEVPVREKPESLTLPWQPGFMHGAISYIPSRKWEIMSFHDDFIRAIREKKLVAVTARTDDKGTIKRTCVPLDYGPSGRPHDGVDRYHFRDLSSPTGEHPFMILPSQLLDLSVLDETFEPEKHVHGKTKWSVPRDWGKFS
ncbi:MAG: hypothetical protein PHD55_06835 [Methanoregula sp.]|nr:hypothetical protein [Methanoregula sp.]